MATTLHGDLMDWLKLLPGLGTLLDRLLPDPQAAADAKLKLMTLAQSGELAQLSADTEIQKGQMAINLADAQSGSNYRGGWRPFLGWTCGMALAWDWVIKQIFVTVWVLAGHAVPVLPQLNMEQIFGLITCLLGVGTMRTFERLRGKA